MRVVANSMCRRVAICIISLEKSCNGRRLCLVTLLTDSPDSYRLLPPRALGALDIFEILIFLLSTELRLDFLDKSLASGRKPIDIFRQISMNYAHKYCLTVNRFLTGFEVFPINIGQNERRLYQVQYRMKYITCFRFRLRLLSPHFFRCRTTDTVFTPCSMMMILHSFFIQIRALFLFFPFP